MMPSRFANAGGSLSLIVVAFLVFLVVPGSPDSAFSGAPLPFASLCLFVAGLVVLAVITLARPTRRVSALWALALLGLAVVKVTTSRGIIPEGWRGVYSMVDAPRIDGVAFIEGFTSPVSRVDRQVDFDGDQFDLGFYNDMPRYGTVWGGVHRDFADPFEVQWTSFFHLDAPAELTFTLRCRGWLAVAVDGTSLTNDPCPNGSIVTHTYAAGEHELAAHYIKPREVTPLATVVPGAVPLSAAPIWVKDARRGTLQIDLGLLVAVLACGITLTSLVVAYRPWALDFGRVLRTSYARVAVLGAFTGLAVVAVQTALPFRNMTTFLWAGDDPLAYESFGRDIALHGLLNPNGAAIGHGQPYYFYPFYPYALAAAHRLFGDDLGAAVLFNGLCIAAFVLVAWALVLRRLPGWAAVAGVGILSAFCLHYYTQYVASAFTDNLYLPLVFGTIWLSVEAIRRWTWWRWVLAGSLAAFAAATRPSFMTYPGIFAVFVILFWHARPFLARIKASAWLAVGFLLGVSPFTIRNWIMAHKVVLLVNSWIQIPFFLEPPDEPHKAQAVAGLFDALRQAAAIVADHPVSVLIVELRKLGFTMGWTPLGPAGQPPHPEFIVVTGLFLVALVWRRVTGSLGFVLLAFAASHITAMILAAPWTYGFKTILPLQVAFLLGALLLLARVRDDEPTPAPAPTATV